MSTGAGTGSTPAAMASLDAFTSLPSDSTGIDTFVRFRWQAKLAVLTWLSTLGAGGPIAVVAEMVEDLVIIEADVFRFAQLKTRDRGSWSAAKICAPGHAVSALVGSFKAAKAAALHEQSLFEVWLEGPPAEDPKTRVFFANPSEAHADIKSKIRAMGLRGGDLTNFLSRLRIRCHRPSRQFIDDVVIRAIGAVWPSMQHQQAVNLYERLLEVATAAQEAAEPPGVVRDAIAAGRLNPADLSGWEPIRTQVMHRAHLIALCPPVTSATNEELAERAATGEASLLELKLVRAGAQPETVAKAISARADADVAAILALSSGRVDAAHVERLNERIIAMAESFAALGVGGSNTQTPAEHVFHTLMTRPVDVSSIDVSKVFEGDARLASVFHEATPSAALSLSG